MMIHFLDGGYAECYEIEVIDNQIYWDGCRYYPVSEVDWIEDDDGSDITADYLGNVFGSTCCVKASKRFTKYPNSYVKSSAFGKPKPVKYETVGDLIAALQKFPADYPVRLVGQTGWGIDVNGNLCFIKNIVDYDDACEIEII